ncbi:hypothetical protein V1512DRAFT_257772 [Lipomyces arxii]|uniref:uncharacterized protein n=1 Tax=Lipomyces arxii TaxID=56418 RepID=UPI0034CFB966
MPITKSLRKVEQKIKKGAVHPKARKFKQLNKATLRETKMNKRRVEREMARDVQLLRLKFLRAKVDSSDKDVFGVDEIEEFVSEFIARDDAELDQLKSTRRPGRPSSGRQDSLQTRRDFEVAEFASGFYVPDLTDRDNVKAVRAWSQDYGGIGLIKFVRVAKGLGVQIASRDDVDMV